MEGKKADSPRPTPTLTFVRCVYKGDSMPTEQQTLDSTHEHMVEITQMWVDGLITDKEFSNSLARFAAKYGYMDLVGLIDPATGLRYN